MPSAAWPDSNERIQLLDYYETHGELPTLHETAESDDLPDPQHICAVADMRPFGAILRDLATTEGLDSAYRQSGQNTRKGWSPKRVVSALVRYYARYGRFPNQQDARFRSDLPDPHTATNHFGTWKASIGAAVESLRETDPTVETPYDGPAGRPKSGPLRHWTRDRITQAIVDFAASHPAKRAPTTREAKSSPDLPHPDRVVSAFDQPFSKVMASIAEDHDMKLGKRKPGAQPRSIIQQPKGTKPSLSTSQEAFVDQEARPGISWRLLLETFRAEAGRFTRTKDALRKQGYAISRSMVKQKVTELYEQEPEIYGQYWPMAPAPMAGNRKPGEWEAKFKFLERHARKNGDCKPPKLYRPQNQNIYQWLKNQELRIERGTMDPAQLERLRSLPGGTERFGRSNASRTL